MKKLLVSLICLFLLTFEIKAEVINPEGVTNLLDRIFCQQSTDNGQQLIVTVLDENLVQRPTANSQQPTAKCSSTYKNHC